MAFKVVIRPLALRDIDETTLHIAEQGASERAGRWREEVFDRIDELQSMPKSRTFAPESEELGVELRQFHRVIFRVVGDTVEVLRVYHGARRAFDVRNLP